MINIEISRTATPGHGPRRLALLLACGLGLLGAGPVALAGAAQAEAGGQRALQGAAASAGSQAPPALAGSASATLEQCQTAQVQSERSATFAGEMAATPATAHMAMRIEVQEWTPSNETFHTVTAPGLGVWRVSAPGVKVYRYLKQITNLSGSAMYRAAVRFRWINARGRQIRSLQRLTASCLQPAPEASPPAPRPQ